MSAVLGATPATFVIGADLPFRADNVRSGRSPYSPIPSATLTYELLDKQTRQQISTGSLTLYDPIPASFEATIPSASIDSCINKREYALRITINNAGVKTIRSATLVALLDGVES